MPDILHDLIVDAPIHRVFEAFATPDGLDAWWTLRAEGEPRVGTAYVFFFGAAYDWRGEVSVVVPERCMEWCITQSDDDWHGTRVGVELTVLASGTHVRFWHTGWREANAHYRTSSFCWAMYLRLMKQWCETGAVVPYETRLSA